MYDKDLLLIKCPVLKRNCEAFLVKELGNNLSNFEDGLNHKDLSTSYAANPPILNLYDSIIGDIRTEFSLNDKIIEDVTELLEWSAITYVASYQTVMRKASLNEMLMQMTDFVADLEKCLKPVERNTRYYKAILTNLSGDETQAAVYEQSFNALLDANKTLQSLPDFVRQSKVMEAVEIGKQAPVGNPSLERWVKTMYDVWTIMLGRTIENKHDGINGRKYLLNFMEVCMRPIHEGIEANTLDNMLRKVQGHIKTLG